VFKPAGIPACSLEEVVLSLDEFEAIRLADLDGLYQEQAAERMNVSRQTFGRILEAARKKVAQVLIEGKALRIEGGEVEMNTVRSFKCQDCQHAWQLPLGGGRPEGCPNCKSINFQRENCGGQGTGGGQGEGGQARKRCCHRRGQSIEKS
jgi:uncharacterized protein